MAWHETVLIQVVVSGGMKFTHSSEMITKPEEINKTIKHQYIYIAIE